MQGKKLCMCTIPTSSKGFAITQEISRNVSILLTSYCFHLKELSGKYTDNYFHCIFCCLIHCKTFAQYHKFKGNFRNTLIKHVSLPVLITLYDLLPNILLFAEDSLLCNSKQSPSWCANFLVLETRQGAAYMKRKGDSQGNVFLKCCPSTL